MLLKLVCDDSCGFVRRLGASEMRIGWVVEENVPLGDAMQIAALNTAIDEGRRETNNNSSAAVTTAEFPGFGDYVLLTSASSGPPLDVRCTPNGLGLKSGTTLKLMCITEQTSGVSEPSCSMGRQSLCPQQQRLETVPLPAVNTEDETDDDNEEVYAARSIGWFPFLLRPCEGEPVVLMNDPHRPVQESDTEPNTRPLCENCAALVSHGDALRVAIDIHHKPMLMHQDYLEMSMEKLGGGQLRRWQSRFVQMSEKSIDWFTEKPKPGVKNRIHGHRYIVRDGECQVEALIRQPDPEQYPHCKDKHYSCFAVTFRNPSKTYFFRVKTEEERTAAVDFLERCMKRVADRAPVRNPVTWKQRVDQFLLNAAQLGEVYSTNRMSIESLQTRMQTLEEELADALEEKPKLLAAVNTQTSYVQTLCAELAGYESDLKKTQQRVKAAECRLVEEEQLLQEQETEMGDDVHKVAILKQYALQQREAAEKRMAELRERAAVLQKEENDVFCKWRRWEERHRVRRDSLRQSGLYSFSQDGIGVPSGTPRLSMELAVSAAQLTLNSESPCSFASPLPSPQRPLTYSIGREEEEKA